MGVLRPRPGPHPVHTLHRISAATLGAFLVLFAVLGLAQGLSPYSSRSAWVLGLSSNGLLSVLSLVVGLVLVVAATRTGPVASTTSILAGLVFLISGVAHSLVLGTSMNLLAFTLSNVVFSMLVGLVLMVTGGYGRISFELPPDNPYRTVAVQSPAPLPESPEEHRRNVVARAELAEAERAAALHYASSEQYRRLASVHKFRSADDRLRAWLVSAQPDPTRQAVVPPQPRAAADQFIAGEPERAGHGSRPARPARRP